MEAMRKSAMNYGLFLGLALIFLTTIMYAVDINLFTSSWIGIVNLLIISGFGVFSATTYKKSLGGFIGFKEAFTCFFITVATGVFLSTLYTVVLLNYIDPEAKTIITENVIKYTVSMMEKFGGKAADMNKIAEEMEKSDSFGPLGQLKGFAFGLVIYAVIGLVSALIIKKERPQSL
jgi:hypothetical protein